MGTYAALDRRRQVSAQSQRGIVRFADDARPHELPERRGGVRHLIAQAHDVALGPQELAVSRVFTDGALQIAAVREHRGEPAVRPQIDRVERDGRPQQRECRDAVPVAQ